MTSEPTHVHVLPETAEILSLLRQLDVHPRTLPETHDILSLLHQLHGAVPVATAPPVPLLSTDTTEPSPVSEVAPSETSDLSFDSFFDTASDTASDDVPGPASDTVPQDGDTSVEPTSFDLSVRAFFNAVPWDHSGRVERIPPPPGGDTAPQALPSSHALDLSV